MKFHEIANIFPLMEGGAFDDLCQDIGANGLIEPIWIWNKQIVDGRNRYRACEKLGLEPEYREWKGDEGSLLPFVISMNLKRRHLNESQRAMVAARLENSRHGGDRKKQDANLHLDRSAAAKMLNVSPRSVATASKVLETAPEQVIAEIDAGELAVSQYARHFARDEKLEKIAKGNRPIQGKKKYSVIYADPPWQYEHPISDSRKIENQYPTMEAGDICALPVPSLAYDDSILFLWVTSPMLVHGIEVMDAWGFEYRTSMVWVKPSIGPGQWIRNRHEYLFIGIRGSIPTPEFKPDSVLEAPRAGHSEKPEVVYDLIEKMYPSLGRVELFARKNRAGWDAWGNEA